MGDHVEVAQTSEIAAFIFEPLEDFEKHRAVPAAALLGIEPQVIGMSGPDPGEREYLCRLECRMPRWDILIPIERNPLLQELALVVVKLLPIEVRMPDATLETEGRQLPLQPRR